MGRIISNIIIYIHIYPYIIGIIIPYISHNYPKSRWFLFSFCFFFSARPPGASSLMRS